MGVPFDPRAASDLHDALVVWLATNHPRAALDVVLAALTFEIGRLVGVSIRGTNTTPAEIDAMVDRVGKTMRAHVTTFLRES